MSIAHLLDGFMYTVYKYSHVLFALVGMLTMLSGVLLSVFVATQKKRKKAKAEEEAAEGGADGEAPAAGEGDPEDAAKGVKGAFGQLRKALGFANMSRRKKYSVPWVLLFGDEDAGQSDVVAELARLGVEDDQCHCRAEALHFAVLRDGVVFAPSARFFAHGKAGDAYAATLLRAFRAVRPRRPLDAVVVTLGAQELCGQEPGTFEAERAAEAAGHRIAERLERIQDALGMSLPVYVLVTGCEQVPGFDALQRAVGDEALRQMFGWTSPKTPDTAYAKSWEEDICGSILSSLDSATQSVFAAPHPPDDAGRIFRLREYFEDLFPALTLRLRTIFQPRSQMQSVPCRGVYFCGHYGEGRGRRTTFVHDVFSKQIFGEMGLASPADRLMVARRRTVRGMQAAVVGIMAVWVLGMAVGHYRVWKESRDVITVLESLKTDFERYQLLGRTGAAAPDMHMTPEEFKQRMEGYISGFNSIDPELFFSVFIPSSWESELRGRILSMARKAVGSVLLRGIRGDLMNRAAHLGLAEGLPVAEGDVRRRAQSLEETPEYRRFALYADKVLELTGRCLMFNGLSASTSAKDFAELTEYSFNATMPKDFAKYAHIVLKDLPYAKVDLTAQAAALEQQEQANLLGVFARAFIHNDVRQELRGVQRLLDALRSGGQQTGGNSLDAFIAAVDALGVFATSPQWAWMQGDVFTPGKGIVDKHMHVRQRIAELSGQSFDPRQAQAMAEGKLEELSGRLVSLRDDVQAMRDEDLGPLLTFDDEGHFAPAAWLIELRDVLADARTRDFMQPVPEGVVNEDVPPEDIAWDVSILSRAVKLLDSYGGYDAQLSKKLPKPSARQVVTTAMNERVAENVYRLVGQAQVYSPYPAGMTSGWEHTLESAAVNFSKASPYILRAVQSLRTMGQVALADAVGSIPGAQAVRLLEMSRMLLERDALFAPQSTALAQWQGTTPVLAGVYGLTTNDEAVAYMTARLGRVRHVVSVFVEPSLTYVYKQGRRDFAGDDDLITYWESIVAALEAYDSKRPGNSVANVETLIMQTFGKTTAKTYATTLSAVEPRFDGPGYFERRGRALISTVRARCLEADLTTFASGYGAASAFFDEHLAGHFPFAPVRTGGPQASVEDVMAFLNMLDGVAGTMPASAARLHALAPQKRFLDAVAGAEPFLRSLVAGKDQSSQCGLTVDFRTQRASEVGGEQIVDWTLTAGEQSVHFRDAETGLTWGPGQDVRFTLEWAQDSDRFPVLAQTLPPGAAVQERRVVWQYTDLWALYAFVRANSAAAGDVKGDAPPPPGTLVFSVATKAADSAVRRSVASAPDGETVTVFMRLHLTQAGVDEKGKPKVTPLAWPTDLPKTMPELDANSVRDELYKAL
jgi:type VI secretion system protein ImpL